MIQNLEEINNLLSGKKPIFKLDGILLGAEIVLRPSPTNIDIIVLRNIKNLVEKIKLFPRWMFGTCHPCKPVKQNDCEELMLFSFYEDVMGIQLINDKIINIQETTQKLSADCWKYLQRWEKYVNLWRLDKPQICQKFSSTNPTLFQYEEKFSFYGAIIDEINEMNSFYDLNCIR